MSPEKGPGSHDGRICRGGIQEGRREGPQRDFTLLGPFQERDCKLVFAGYIQPLDMFD